MHNIGSFVEGVCNLFRMELATIDGVVVGFHGGNEGSVVLVNADGGLSEEGVELFGGFKHIR